MDLGRSSPLANAIGSNFNTTVDQYKKAVLSVINVKDIYRSIHIYTHEVFWL